MSKKGGNGRNKINCVKKALRQMNCDSHKTES